MRVTPHGGLCALFMGEFDMRATAFFVALPSVLLSLSLATAQPLAARDRDEAGTDTTTLLASVASPPVSASPEPKPSVDRPGEADAVTAVSAELAAEVAAKAGRLIRKVRSFLARDQPSSARCLYRSLQRLDPSLVQKKTEEAIRAFEASEQASWSGPLDPDWVRDPALLPRKVHTVTPKYSPRARSAGIEAKMGLRATITRDGLVAEVAIVESTAPAHDLKALEALCQWRFEPVRIDGQAIDVYYNVILKLFLGTPKPTR